MKMVAELLAQARASAHERLPTMTSRPWQAARAASKRRVHRRSVFAPVATHNHEWEHVSGAWVGEAEGNGGWPWAVGSDEDVVHNSRWPETREQAMAAALGYEPYQLLDPDRLSLRTPPGEAPKLVAMLGTGQWPSAQAAALGALEYDARVRGLA